MRLDFARVIIQRLRVSPSSSSSSSLLISVRGVNSQTESGGDERKANSRRRDPVWKRLELLKQTFQSIERSRLFASSSFSSADNLTREREQYERLEAEVNEHMRAYKNIHQVPHFYWSYFIYFFTFYPKKLKLILRLVDKQPDLFPRNKLLPILAGLVRFNCDLQDADLLADFDRVNRLYLKRKSETAARDAGDSAYRDVFYSFLLRCNSRADGNQRPHLSEKQVDFMLQSWSTSNYIPDKFMFRNMIKMLDKDVWSVTKIDSEMYSTIHSQLGLARAHFDPDELSKVADKLKESELQVEHESREIKERKVITFDQIDKILAESSANFKYVVDGMNVMYYEDKSRNPDSLHKLTELIKEDCKSLVILREHVKNVNKELYLNKNIRFVFLGDRFDDDRFILYAALRSSMCNNLYLITMDLMSDHAPMGRFGYTLQRWLMQKRVDLNISLSRLFYKPECEIKVQRCSTPATWFVPVSFPVPNSPDSFKYYVLRSKLTK